MNTKDSKDPTFCHDVRELKDLQKKISLLHQNEHLEILRIIRTDPIKYTENNNGVFLNMMKLQPQTLQKIQSLVDFCSQNSELLEKEQIKRESIRNMVEKEIQSSATKETTEENGVLIEQQEKLDLGNQWTLDKDYQSTQQHIETLINNKESNNLSTFRKHPKFSGTEARIIKKSRDTSIEKQKT